MEYIDGIINKTVYNEVLKKNVEENAQKLGMLPSFIFEKYSDSKHTAEINKLWVTWNVPQKLKTPPQSADLKQIEYLWPF